MRILFALSGLHRVERGAEIAFISIASELVRQGKQVTLIGSGPTRSDRSYRYIRAASIGRERFERFPSLPMFRNETTWEDASFAPGLLRAYRPSDYDVTLTCSYPFTNWVLRRPASGGQRPPHVFVTQNGDWPAISGRAEFRFFGCDGLVCINPDYYERNSEHYRCALIPNGVDLARFTPGSAERSRLGLGGSGPLVLMVSALIPSKNIREGIRAVSRVPEATLVVAGDGPQRDELAAFAAELLPGRYRQVRVPATDMPALYRSADVFLHLSRDESFGNVYVEAMACGVPIVAFDLSRTRWIVGEEGFLADACQPNAIEAQIIAALDAGPEVSERLVKRAERFDWSRVADRYSDFLEQVVRESQAYGR